MYPGTVIGTLWPTAEFNKVTLYECTLGQGRRLLIDRSVADETVGKVAEANWQRGRLRDANGEGF